MSDEEMSAEDMVRNIEEHGEVNPKLEESSDKAPASTINFASNDDLMKHQLEYTANGKTVKEDLATIIKRASQGYNYAQSMAGLKSRDAEIAQREQSIQGIADKWQKYEQYAQQNPQWYEHWTQAWDNRGIQAPGGGSGDGGEIDSQLTALLDQKLQPFQEFMTSQQAERQQAEIREQDSALDQSIKSTREAFPSIDFDKSDPETGKTLEWQVLEFAHQEGMNDFNKAFKVFYHDNLIKSQIEQEKAKWAKEQEGNRRKGVLGDVPTKKANPKQADFNKASWDQVAEMAARDLGFGS